MNKHEKLSLYKDIQKEVKRKYRLDLSLEEIEHVTSSQFKIMLYGFTKGFSTKLPYLGNFLYTNFEKKADDYIKPMIQENLRLVNLNHHKEAHILRATLKDRYEREINQFISSYSFTVDEVLNAPDVLEGDPLIDIYNL